MRRSITGNSRVGCRIGSKNYGLRCAAGRTRRAGRASWPDSSRGSYHSGYSLRSGIALRSCRSSSSGNGSAGYADRARRTGCTRSADRARRPHSSGVSLTPLRAGGSGSSSCASADRAGSAHRPGWAKRSRRSLGSNTSGGTDRSGGSGGARRVAHRSRRPDGTCPTDRTRRARRSRSGAGATANGGALESWLIATVARRLHGR